MPKTNQPANRFAKMSSATLLNRVASGTLNNKDAKLAALVLERRFPSPLMRKTKRKHK